MRAKNLCLLTFLLFSIAVLIYGGAILCGKEKAKRPAVPQKRYISPFVTISPYDHHFRNVADSLGWDWKFLAAIAHTESRFDSTAVSEVGAGGVMQVMPSTMQRLGIPDSLHLDTRTNIEAAGRLLMNLNHLYRRIENFDERTNFILASYNAGSGHIGDAMNLAEKHGCPRYVWENNVDSFLVLKSLPEFYTDSVCRNGSFNDWKQTLSFVKKVKRTWTRYRHRQARYSDSLRVIMQQDTLLTFDKEHYAGG